MQMKDFRHLNFELEATQTKFKVLLRRLFDARPELIEPFSKAIDAGVRERAITANQATVMKRLYTDVLADVVDDSINELATALDVDLTFLRGEK